MNRTRTLGSRLHVVLTALLALCLLCAGTVAHAWADSDTITIGTGNTTSDVTINFYKDSDHKNEYGSGDTILSTATVYGHLRLELKDADTPTQQKPKVAYQFPSNIKVDDRTGGTIRRDGVKVADWSVKDNAATFAFDADYLAAHPSDVYAELDFEFNLADSNVSTGQTVKIEFPGNGGSTEVTIEDGKVTGEKSGKYNASTDKVEWTVKLKVESYATGLVFTDTLGTNFTFDAGSFKLDGETLNPQPAIAGQTATLNMGNLSKGTYKLTYTTSLNQSAIDALGNLTWINKDENSKNTASWEWGGTETESPKTNSATKQPSDFRYDMIAKTGGTGTTDDVSWTVTLNQGDIKANMNGYVFTDTLKNNQTYKGGFTVYKGASGSTVLYEGTIPAGSTSFTYTFSGLSAEDARLTYRIVYHTQLTDQTSTALVYNVGKIYQEGKPSGKVETSYNPVSGQTWVAKQLVDSSHAAAEGTATWKTTADFSVVPAGIDATSVHLQDTFSTDYKQTILFQNITVTLGDTVLTEGTDYVVNYPSGYGEKVLSSVKIDIQFKNSRTVVSACGTNATLTVEYTTLTDALNGTYRNQARFWVVNQGWQDTDTLSYTVDREWPTSVQKSGKASWDDSFSWADVDGTEDMGAWVVTWTVYVNRYETDGGQYYAAGNLGGQDVVISDVLPDNASFKSGSAKYTLYDSANKEVSGAKGKKIVPTDGADGTTLFTVPTTALGNNKGYVKLEYKTVSKASVVDAATNEGNITNTASATSGDKTFEAGGDTVTVSNKVLTKEGKQVEDSSHIRYTIGVNQGAAKLNAAGDTLELTDTMDSKCTLEPTTVKVYEYKNKKWAELGEDEWSVSAGTVQEEGVIRTVMTFTLPDSKYLKVEYEVQPAGEVGQKVTLRNDAKLVGSYETTAFDEKDWVIQRASADAGGSGHGVTVTKVDKDQITHTLSGATFTMWEVDMDKAATDGIDAAKTEFQTVTTDANGVASFGTDAKGMEAYKLYFYEETTAPVGYELSTERTWVLLQGENEDTYNAALAKALTIEGVTDPKFAKSYIAYNEVTATPDPEPEPEPDPEPEPEPEPEPTPDPEPDDKGDKGDDSDDKGEDGSDSDDSDGSDDESGDSDDESDDSDDSGKSDTPVIPDSSNDSDSSDGSKNNKGNERDSSVSTLPQTGEASVAAQLVGAAGGMLALVGIGLKRNKRS